MDCINWTGYVNNAGYGTRTVKGNSTSAHRHAWEEANGAKVPEGMVVMHSCANRLCVNPEHLTIGTQSENCQEKSARGAHWNQSFTAEEAALILWCRRQGPRKGNYGWTKKVADIFGVHVDSIRRVCLGRTYQGVN